MLARVRGEGHPLSEEWTTAVVVGERRRRALPSGCLDRDSSDVFAELIHTFESLMRTAAQTKYLESRRQDILGRITHALPDWSAENLQQLALQMAELEIGSEARAAVRSRLAVAPILRTSRLL